MATEIVFILHSAEVLVNLRVGAMEPSTVLFESIGVVQVSYLAYQDKVLNVAQLDQFFLA